MELTARQQRELDYHREHAARHAQLRNQPVDTDVLDRLGERPWNAYWYLMARVAAEPLVGTRWLVPGCGFGEDAIRLALLGAEVTATDLSPESLEITETRARRAGIPRERLATIEAPCERMPLPAATFDGVLLRDILHHADIPAVLDELRRLLKPRARILGSELYTHRALQRIRESRPVSRWLYPWVAKVIYGGRDPYITADERKLDERDLARIENAFPGLRLTWYLLVVQRFLPDSSDAVARLDRAVLRALGAAGRVLAGRVVLEGRMPLPRA
jgi:ubiquinone/menaquinone biosynthesis C-methylase UbiE